MADRVLILSWEYPPVIEGGLARHVRKLAEELVRQGVEVDVLTRGKGERSLAETGTDWGDTRSAEAGGRSPLESIPVSASIPKSASPEGACPPASVGNGAEQREEVSVYRVREPQWPRDLDRFVGWVQRMNEDMVQAGEALAEERSYDLVHGHDWLVAHAGATLAERTGVPYLTTVHATEHGRHQGWVQDEPQAHIHAWSGGWPSAQTG